MRDILTLENSFNASLDLRKVFNLINVEKMNYNNNISNLITINIEDFQITH